MSLGVNQRQPAIPFRHGKPKETISPIACRFKPNTDLIEFNTSNALIKQHFQSLSVSKMDEELSMMNGKLRVSDIETELHGVHTA